MSTSQAGQPDNPESQTQDAVGAGGASAKRIGQDQATFEPAGATQAGDDQTTFEPAGATQAGDDQATFEPAGVGARRKSASDAGTASEPEVSPYERFFTGTDVAMEKPEPMHVNTPRVILIGTALWLVALVVTLVVPSLHSGSRGFWPWACVCGFVLGLLGYTYVRRGRGNAEAA